MADNVSGFELEQAAPEAAKSAGNIISLEPCQRCYFTHFPLKTETT
jgi:hypothetical protein